MTHEASSLRRYITLAVILMLSAPVVTWPEEALAGPAGGPTGTSSFEPGQGNGVRAVHSSVTAASAAKTTKRTRSSSRRGSAKGRRTILEAQQQLADMGYWTGPIDGVVGQRFHDCLIAFQKVEGRPRTGRLTRSELEAIREASRPAPFQGGPFHVEIDLARQVLFVVGDDGVVARILPVSTGNDEWFTTDGWTRRAYTPCGRFRIFGKIEGWRKSELGLLYYPNYIAGGIAIHGSKSVPAFPASHGCVRIPMYAAKDFSEMTPVGIPVIVHGGTSGETADRSQGVCRTPSGSN